MSNGDAWLPGQPVKLIGPRVIVHTLGEGDLGGSVEDWTGTAERNRFIWKPSMPTREYLRALISYCDQQTRFAFGIRERESEELIGYRKVQLVSEDNGRGSEPTAIQTMLIGDAWAGRALGQEAGALCNWFFFLQVGARAISPRIYDDNEQTWRLAEKVGYRLVRRYTESGPNGERAVRVYTMTREEMEDRFGNDWVSFKMESRTPS